MSQNDWTSGTFTALRGDKPELTLYCYEELKADMSFDPEAKPPELPEFEPWLLEEDYPPSVAELISNLTISLALSPERFLALQWVANQGYGPDTIEQFAQALAEQQREERQDDLLPQASQAEGHVESGAGGTAVEGDSERGGEVGQGRSDQDGEGGQAQPLSGQ